MYFHKEIKTQSSYENMQGMIEGNILRNNTFFSWEI